MKIHEFGEANRTGIVIIHGACMSWDMLKASIDILARQFHVYAVALPGHDTTTDEEFSTIEGIAARIVLTLFRYGLRQADLLYGLSLGGSVALRIIADGELPVSRAIIDGGLMPCGTVRLLARSLFSPGNVMVSPGRRTRAALAAEFPPVRYPAVAIDRMYEVISHMSDATIRKVSERIGNFTLPEKLPVSLPVTEYWYGQDEENSRKYDIEYIKGLIPDITLRRLPGMAHGQYAIGCPEQFAADVFRRLNR